MRKGFLSFTGAVVVLAAFALFQPWIETARAKHGKTERIVQPQFREGEAVVRLKRPAAGKRSSGMQLHLLLNQLGQSYAVNVVPMPAPSRKAPQFATVVVDNRVPMGQLLADIEATGIVEYAEPNYLYYASRGRPKPAAPVVPNDPDFGANWGLLNIGQLIKDAQPGLAGADMGAARAWNLATGAKSVLVAVIDTGVDYEHEDLRDNIFVNTAEIAENGLDDDGNGYVDDVRGWNFAAGNNNPQDDNSHGTHVAGTIAAAGNNGIGTVGVNWTASVLPIKFLDAEGGGTLSAAVSAIQYAATMKAKVINASWGGPKYSQAMRDAIAQARDAGALFVAAAGNDGSNNDAEPSYPASYELDNVLSVAATDNRDRRTSWSNYGRKSVQLAAPGLNIYSTLPMSMGKYGFMSGTSMACPHAAGAAALLWGANASMDYAQIKARLVSTVDALPWLRAQVASGGRLNVHNALTNTIPAPAPVPPADAWKQVQRTIESDHPYANGTKLSFVVSHPGAKFLRVHFEKIQTERGYDVIRLKSADGDIVDELTGIRADYTSEYATGDRIIIEFATDSGVQDYGYLIDRYEVIE